MNHIYAQHFSGDIRIVGTRENRHTARDVLKTIDIRDPQEWTLFIRQCLIDDTKRPCTPCALERGIPPRARGPHAPTPKRHTIKMGL